MGWAGGAGGAGGPPLPLPIPMTPDTGAMGTSSDFCGVRVFPFPAAGGGGGLPDPVADCSIFSSVLGMGPAPPPFFFQGPCAPGGGGGPPDPVAASAISSSLGGGLPDPDNIFSTFADVSCI